MVFLKENSDEPETGAKIRSVLMPVEYTRLDGLVDVMFTTAKDLESDLTAEVPAEIESAAVAETATEPNLVVHEMTDARLLQLKREAIVGAMSARLGEPLIKKSRALYQSPDHKKRIACTLSKRYETGSTYWYHITPNGTTS